MNEFIEYGTQQERWIKISWLLGVPQVEHRLAQVLGISPQHGISIAWFGWTYESIHTLKIQSLTSGLRGRDDLFKQIYRWMDVNGHSAFALFWHGLRSENAPISPLPRPVPGARKIK